MEQQRLKVHRRKAELDGAVYTVLTPRADEGPRITVTLADDGASNAGAGNEGASTGGASIGGDELAGGRLGQLCWAMAYQRTPYTFAVVESVGGAPVVIANNDLGDITTGSLEALRSKLPWQTDSDGTVNLNTRSLESAVANEPAFYANQKRDGIGDIKHQSRFVKPVGDLLVLAAPGIVLKSWGVQLSTPDDRRPTWFLTAGS